LSSLLSRRIIFVTGKGGTGKTTVAAGLGWAAARRGRRTVVCEIGGGPSRLAPLLGRPDGFSEDPALDGLLGTARIEPDAALDEWLRGHVGRAAGRLLGRSHGFRAFVAAAPGARELIAMGKAWDLAGGPSRSSRSDLVIVDGPSTGHALALLAAPSTFARIGGPSPLGRDAQKLVRLIGSARALAVLGVAQPTELAVAETLELDAGVHEVTGHSLAAVAVNAVSPRRFSAAERDAVERACMARQSPTADAAWRAARLSYRSRRAQEANLRHLRAGLARPVVSLPYVFATELLDVHVRELGERLARAVF
jgi:anion-transporting  ArsA/GET3 family ATPase